MAVRLWAGRPRHPAPTAAWRSCGGRPGCGGGLWTWGVGVLHRREGRGTRGCGQSARASPHSALFPSCPLPRFLLVWTTPPCTRLRHIIRSRGPQRGQCGHGHLSSGERTRPPAHRPFPAAPHQCQTRHLSESWPSGLSRGLPWGLEGAGPRLHLAHHSPRSQRARDARARAGTSRPGVQHCPRGRLRASREGPVR